MGWVGKGSTGDDVALVEAVVLGMWLEGEHDGGRRMQRKAEEEGAGSGGGSGEGGGRGSRSGIERVIGDLLLHVS